MMKLSDTTFEERQAVVRHFGMTNEVLTPDQMERLINSFNGGMVILRIRIRKLGKEIKEAAKGAINGR